jgi:ParB-like chromosome segregation protein Spo0J
MPIVSNRPQLPSVKKPSAAKLEVQYFTLNALRPSARNPRQHSRKKIRQLANTIRTLRVLSPILVDENFEILAGHARYEAAKLLGLKPLS